MTFLGTVFASICLAMTGLGVASVLQAMRAGNAQWIHWRTVETIGFLIAAALFFMVAK